MALQAANVAGGLGLQGLPVTAQAAGGLPGHLPKAAELAGARAQELPEAAQVGSAALPGQPLHRR